VVRATLREGDDLSVGNTAFNAGALIAEGTTAPATLAGPLSTGPVSHDTVDGRAVYGFHLSMPLQRTTLDASEGYNLRVDVFMDNPACADAAAEDFVMPDLMASHSDPEHRPRFTWMVANPISIDYVMPRFTGDDLVIDASYSSPWGAFDLAGDARDPGPAPALAIAGPVTPALEASPGGQAHYEHGESAATQPVSTQWVWKDAVSAPDGRYTVTFEAATDQGATGTSVTTFEVGDGSLRSLTVCSDDGCNTTAPEPLTATTPGLGVAIMPLLAALVLARRGKSP
jgi:hypothetical protein